MLIIEDDAIVATVYRILLNNRGYEALVETDGVKGLARLREWRPDAVLLDIMLPGVNGVEILKKIRADDDSGAVPVLVFTNAFVSNMVEIAKISGATHVFSKSTLTSRQLLDALAMVVPGAPALAPVNPLPAGIQIPGATGDTTFDQPRPVPGSVPSTDGVHIRGTVLPNLPPPGSSPATEFLHRSGGAVAARPPSDPPPASVIELPHAKVRNEFLQGVNASMHQVRLQLSDLSRASNEQSQAGILEELYKQIRSLGGSAGLAGFQPAADLCSAFEILLQELHQKPKHLNPSIQRTVANTVDSLTDLLVKRLEGNLLADPAPSILVVDDEVLSRRAVTFALEKARLTAHEVSDPKEALQLATRQPYDLIFLDVQMPEINGFDLCTQIRAQVVNQKTPVIFVTGMSDFKSRVRSTLSGATDLIAKPFMFFELTVKAVSTLLQARSQRGEKKTTIAA